jgi:hypothetical protein
MSARLDDAQLKYLAEYGTRVEVMLAQEILDWRAKRPACDCWDRVNALIKHGPLPGNGCDLAAERNGLVLAANAILRPTVEWARVEP